MDTVVTNTQKLYRQKGALFVIEHALAVLSLHIKARLTMMILPPWRWPLYVDQYLLRYAGGFQRIYTYPASYRFPLTNVAAFGHFMNLTEDMPGDLAEFGVYQGGSLVTWAKNIKLMGLPKKVYGFDSFTGYPEIREIDTTGANPLQHNAAWVGGLNETSLEVAQRYVRQSGVEDVVEIVKGNFQDGFPNHQDLKFCQIFIDCDMYESHKAVLEYAYPRMVPGGIMMFEEYDDWRFPGAKKAIDEYFADKPEKIEVLTALRLGNRPDRPSIAFAVKK